MSLSDTAEYWAGRRSVRMPRFTEMDVVERILSPFIAHGLIQASFEKNKVIVNGTLRILRHHKYQVEEGPIGEYKSLRVFICEHFGIESPLNADYQFLFGKYRGQWYTSVMKSDPAYIAWCEREIPKFQKITDRIVKAIEQQQTSNAKD